MASGMKLDVYPTDAEAFEAAAARAAEHLAAVPGPSGATVALAGGRSGRGVMLALAARGDLPWDRIEWYWGDERCVPPDDRLSNVRLARESLLVPRGVSAARIHPPPLELGDPERVAAAYADTLVAGLATGPQPTFDLVLLGVGPCGSVASLMPGSAALCAAGPVAAVGLAEVADEPRVARVTVTPTLLQRARHVIVTVTGDAKSTVVGRTLNEPLDPERLPAQLVRPSATVEWIVDRAAVAALLRDARQVAEPQ
jgi:6-phosphogluconolactonase